LQINKSLSLVLHHPNRKMPSCMGDFRWNVDVDSAIDTRRTSRKMGEMPREEKLTKLLYETAFAVKGTVW